MASRQNLNMLGVYFLLNLFVTFTNNSILSVDLAKFQKPYLLTAVHGISNTAGCLLLNFTCIRSRTRTFQTVSTSKRPLNWSQHAGLAMFSLFYTINIALSNWSLTLVNLPMSQTIRATAPIITVAMSICILGRSYGAYSISTYLSLILITAGVVIATTGASLMSFHLSRRDDATAVGMVGVLITILGAWTAVLKTILTHKFMTSLSLQLSSVEILQILSPYASIQALIFAYFNGEFLIKISHSSSPLSLNSGKHSTLHGLHESSISTTLEYPALILWLTNAIAAFLLNVASFQANKTCGPVSMAVTANLKQVVVLVLPTITAAMGFQITKEKDLTTSMVVGTFLTVAGGLWYGLDTAKTKTQDTVQQDKIV